MKVFLLSGHQLHIWENWRGEKKYNILFQYISPIYPHLINCNLIVNKGMLSGKELQNRKTFTCLVKTGKLLLVLPVCSHFYGLYPLSIYDNNWKLFDIIPLFHKIFCYLTDNFDLFLPSGEFIWNKNTSVKRLYVIFLFTHHFLH